MKMQFKIDENLPVEIAELLTEAGHDAKTVNDQHLEGSLDSLLANVCRDENRALITLDTDFSDITAYPPESFPGIIVLRIRRQAKSHIIDVLRRIMPLLSRERLAQHLWIVEENRLRIRGKNDAL